MRHCQKPAVGYPAIGAGRAPLISVRRRRRVPWPGGAMRKNSASRALGPVMRRALHLYWRFARGMTLGVRAVVLDGENRVFLVLHSYVAGWHLPGGGVEVGESILDGLKRELWEEGRIELVGQPALHGIFF